MHPIHKDHHVATTQQSSSYGRNLKTFHSALWFQSYNLLLQLTAHLGEPRIPYHCISSLLLCCTKASRLKTTHITSHNLGSGNLEGAWFQALRWRDLGRLGSSRQPGLQSHEKLSDCLTRAREDLLPRWLAEIAGGRRPQFILMRASQGHWESSWYISCFPQSKRWERKGNSGFLMTKSLKSHNFCFVLLVRSKSLYPAHAKGEGNWAPPPLAIIVSRLNLVGLDPAAAEISTSWR